MIWLQENWMIAVVGLVVAVVLLWWLFGRAKPAEIAPPTAEPVKPAKPLEPVRPEIVAAEPARFKPVEPKLQPPAPPAPLPADTAPPPATSSEMMVVIASSAAAADFLSASIFSARAATNWVLVIGLDMSISSFRTVIGAVYYLGLSALNLRYVAASHNF